MTLFLGWLLVEVFYLNCIPDRTKISAPAWMWWVFTFPFLVAIVIPIGLALAALFGFFYVWIQFVEPHRRVRNAIEAAAMLGIPWIAIAIAALASTNP